MKNKKGETLNIIVKVLENNKMKRKELIDKSGLTTGQIAGCIHKNKKTNGILKFKEGYFYVENNV